MKVETKLEIFEDYDGGSIEERIMKIASEQLMKGLSPTLSETIREIVINGLTEKIGTLFLEIVDQPVVETNRWGERKGESVTLREFILKQAGEYLNEKVDPDTGDAPRYGRDSNIRRIEYLARNAVRAEFNAIMEPQIKELKALARMELDELKALIESRKV